MSKITSFDELKKRTEEMKNLDTDKVAVKVSMATCSIAAGSKPVLEVFQNISKENDNIKVIETGCMGFCHSEPTVEITVPGKEPVIFGKIDTEKATKLVDEYIKNGDFINGVIPYTFKTPDTM